MLNGRQKMGSSGIDWKMAALGFGKKKRKTVGFGKYDKKEREWEDEVYIRELSIIEGGIGCALWDAAIILSRWIMKHPDYFHGKTVIELGSGVGLPGIVAARFAEEVYLTDYMDQIIDNINYNIFLNTNYEEEEEDSDDEQIKNKIQLKNRVKKTAKALFFDWHDIDNVEKRPSMPKADILLGSELTYTGDRNHISSLVKVINHYLKPGGQFIEILSDDRDGVSLFEKMMAEEGYQEKTVPVQDDLMGHFGTGQRPETYKIYFLSKKDS
eukprot:gb/GECH01010492.1/.p1 GENE.gb/GECH01010492.1/~~gb/GECH01010492.1/.p1  ORF type:complete len:269 (+),score=80.78 gb/GECH01010492.1/:1-807(+)